MSVRAIFHNLFPLLNLLGELLQPLDNPLIEVGQKTQTLLGLFELLLEFIGRLAWIRVARLPNPRGKGCRGLFAVVVGNLLQQLLVASGIGDVDSFVTRHEGLDFLADCRRKRARLSKGG